MNGMEKYELLLLKWHRLKHNNEEYVLVLLCEIPIWKSIKSHSFKEARLNVSHCHYDKFMLWYAERNVSLAEKPFCCHHDSCISHYIKIEYNPICCVMYNTFRRGSAHNGMLLGSRCQAL